MWEKERAMHIVMIIIKAAAKCAGHMNLALEGKVIANAKATCVYVP